MFMSTNEEGCSIGEVARRCGVSTDTLRHYERKGVIPKPMRRQNNYRVYSARTVERVLLVRRALALGFTLEELTRILAERDRGGAPCESVKALAEEKLAALEIRLQELTALRGEFKEILAKWDGALMKNPEPGRPAHLLEMLDKDKPS